MHQNGHLKPLYLRALSVQAYKHQNCSDDWPKVATSGSLGLSNLAVRGTHFEPTVWILPVKSRAEKFSLLKTRLPSSTSYKQGCISWPEAGENRVQNRPKNSPSAPIYAVFLSLSLSAVPATNQGRHKLLHHQLHHRQLSQPQAGHPHA